MASQCLPKSAFSVIQGVCQCCTKVAYYLSCRFILSVSNLVAVLRQSRVHSVFNTMHVHTQPNIVGSVPS